MGCVEAEGQACGVRLAHSGLWQRAGLAVSDFSVIETEITLSEFLLEKKKARG